MTVHPAFPATAAAAPDSAPLAVRVVDPLALSDDLAAAWDGLADEASEPNPFVERWCLQPALHLFDPAREARLVMVMGDRDGPLIGAALTDVLIDGLSMVYSFYEPEMQSDGLGTFMILDHIERARRRGLPYLYLGYWVQGSRKMDYKRRYKPLEYLTSSGWAILPDEPVETEFA